MLLLLLLVLEGDENMALGRMQERLVVALSPSAGLGDLGCCASGCTAITTLSVTAMSERARIDGSAVRDMNISVTRCSFIERVLER